MESYAICPLTMSDTMAQTMNLCKAWVVTGIIDTDVVKRVLDVLVEKWPVLGGRIQPSPHQEKLFEIRVPLGKLPEGYQAYGFSTTNSTTLLTTHTGPIPLKTVTTFPPEHVFMPEHRYKLGAMGDYAKSDAPIMHWHVTHFRQSLYPQEHDPHERHEYSCIGIHYNHGIFDGVGFSLVIKAFEAELHGREWEAPPLPSPGLNVNVYQSLLDAELHKAQISTPPSLELKREPEIESEGRNKLRAKRPPLKATVNQNGPRLPFRAEGLGGIAKYIVRQTWRRIMYGETNYNVIIPYKVHRRLVEEARRKLQAEGNMTPVSTGDVIMAWVMKVISPALPRSLLCSSKDAISTFNVASLRSEPQEDWQSSLALYPHNCISAFGGPLFYLSDLCDEAPGKADGQVHKVAHQLNAARKNALLCDPSRAPSMIPLALGAHAEFVRASKMKPVGAQIPTVDGAKYVILVSNVSIARIVDLDWGPAIVGYDATELCGIETVGEGQGKGDTSHDDFVEPFKQGRSVCHYKYFPGRVSSRSLTLGINGRLDNGDLVTSCWFGTKAARALEAEIERLAEAEP